MRTQISIRIYDPDWLELSKEEQDEIKVLKQDDIEYIKYLKSVAFDFGYPVKNLIDKGKTSYPLRILPAGRTSADESVDVQLNEVYVVQLEGKESNQRGEVVVSAELMVGEFSATKSGAKRYGYIYLNGGLTIHNLAPNIFLSEEHAKMIAERYPNCLYAGSDINVIAISHRIS